MIGRVARAAIPATDALRSGSRASRVRWIWRFLAIATAVFEPKIVEKRQRRVAGLDETIMYLYAQGQSTRAIQDTLRRLYGAEVSSTLVSEVTASVSRGGDRMAGSSSGACVSDRVLRRLVRKVSRGGIGEEAGGLRGAERRGRSCGARGFRRKSGARSTRLSLRSGGRDWERLTPFFDYAPAIRKVVYTTNAIESLNYSLRKIVKGRGAFPNDDAVRKLLYLGLREASKKWKRPIRDWKAALNQFVILYGDRVPIEQ